MDSEISSDEKPKCRAVTSGHLKLQVFEAIQQGIDSVNKTAASKAQCIQKWSILSRDFSVFGGELGQSVLVE